MHEINTPQYSVASYMICPVILVTCITLAQCHLYYAKHKRNEFCTIIIISALYKVAIWVQQSSIDCGDKTKYLLNGGPDMATIILRINKIAKWV